MSLKTLKEKAKQHFSFRQDTYLEQIQARPVGGKNNEWLHVDTKEFTDTFDVTVDADCKAAERKALGFGSALYVSKRNIAFKELSKARHHFLSDYVSSLFAKYSEESVKGTIDQLLSALTLRGDVAINNTLLKQVFISFIHNAFYMDVLTAKEGDLGWIGRNTLELMHSNKIAMKPSIVCPIFSGEVGVGKTVFISQILPTALENCVLIEPTFPPASSELKLKDAKSLNGCLLFVSNDAIKSSNIKYLNELKGELEFNYFYYRYLFSSQVHTIKRRFSVVYTANPQELIFDNLDSRRLLPFDIKRVDRSILRDVDREKLFCEMCYEWLTSWHRVTDLYNNYKPSFRRILGGFLTSGAERTLTNFNNSFNFALPCKDAKFCEAFERVYNAVRKVLASEGEVHAFFACSQSPVFPISNGNVRELLSDQFLSLRKISSMAQANNLPVLKVRSREGRSVILLCSNTSELQELILAMYQRRLGHRFHFGRFNKNFGEALRALSGEEHKEMFHYFAHVEHEAVESGGLYNI